MADSSGTSISNGTVYYKESSEDSKHCFKHATENLSQVSKPDAKSEPEICEGCSKTVLSYISLIQDMLNGLARKLTKDKDPASCVQCLKQDTENASPGEKIEDNNLKSENFPRVNGIANRECETLPPVSTVVEQKDEPQTNQNVEQHIVSSITNAAETTSEPKKPKKVPSRRNSRRISREMKENGNVVFPENSCNRNGWQTDFLYNVSSSIDPKYIPYSQQQENENPIAANLNKRGSSQVLINHKESTSSINYSSHSNSSETSPLTPSSPTLFFANLGSPRNANSEKSTEHMNFNKTKAVDSSMFNYSATESNRSYHKAETNCFAKPDYSATEITVNLHEIDDSTKSDYSVNESNSSHFEVDVDDSSKSDYSGTESVERNVNCKSMRPAQCEKIANQNLEQWNNLNDSFRVCATATDRKPSEAFVTICRNNAEALGCLVLGSSLLLSRTSRKLCILVFDDVDPAFKEPLSSIFHVVQHVRHLNSIDERKLEYLKKANLEKLSIWGLVQFSKCVFLNPDCLVIRNCDELFQHEELSAVPDIGWPDCFNAGVFVFAPSTDTLSKMVELSQKQGQNNEGDQVLLNTYFNSWSSDIGKKLSFIYNLMRNASYTYGPAFQRFGHNVKIVQFLGGSKPWEVKFFTETGQLEGDVNVHPKHVRFFSEWINTFKIAVLKLFPQVVYDYAFNQKSVCAEDIGLALCFPTPCNDLDKISVKPFRILPKRQTVSPFYIAESSPITAICDNTSLPEPICCQLSNLNSVEEATEKVISIGHIEQNGKIDAGIQNGEIERETVLTDSPFDRCLPGAIVGDYQGMMAWEQGNIDYEGCDSSENIMSRLSFLIHRSVSPNL